MHRFECGEVLNERESEWDRRSVQGGMGGGGYVTHRVENRLQQRVHDTKARGIILNVTPHVLQQHCEYLAHKKAAPIT